MKKGLGIAVAVVLGVLAASWIYRDKQPNIEQQLDTALANMPVWQIIKEQEPDFRKKVQDEMIALQKSGKNEQQIIDAIQPQILHLQMARLQNAPDPDGNRAVTSKWSRKRHCGICPPSGSYLPAGLPCLAHPLDMRQRRNKILPDAFNQPRSCVLIAAGLHLIRRRAGGQQRMPRLCATHPKEIADHAPGCKNKCRPDGKMIKFTPEGDISGRGRRERIYPNRYKN
jgi:hypothetical protein